MKIRKGDLVQVLWLDAGSPATPSWIEEEEAGGIDLVSCESVGWVVNHTSKKIVLAAARTEYQDVNSVQMIPMGCVTSIQRMLKRKR